MRRKEGCNQKFYHWKVGSWLVLLYDINSTNDCHVKKIKNDKKSTHLTQSFSVLIQTQFIFFWRKFAHKNFNLEYLNFNCFFSLYAFILVNRSHLIAIWHFHQPSCHAEKMFYYYIKRRNPLIMQHEHSTIKLLSVEIVM